MKEEPYIRALRYAWLNRLYDPVVALTCREQTFRPRLLELAHLGAGDRVLDLGCGTGTFALMIKKAHPATNVAGLDGDSAILLLAREKAREAGATICFDRGMSFAMPYERATFDKVFASLFFHHLRSTDKVQTMEEVRRVLKPGGEFFICDWGPASGSYAKLAFTAVRMLDGFGVTRDSVDGRLPLLLRQAGFDEVRESGVLETMLGTLHFLAARRRE